MRPPIGAGDDRAVPIERSEPFIAVQPTVNWILAGAGALVEFAVRPRRGSVAADPIRGGSSS